MADIRLESDLLNYIIKQGFQPGDRLPTISELQDPNNLGISVSKVREQLEVARALGLVDVRSKTGTHLKDYSFTPAVRLSLFFALATDLGYFELFSELRTHVEMAFWNEAVTKLTDADKVELRSYVDAARAKLHGTRVRIPFEEHRAFHLTIFRHLENPFVIGLLEAYWDAYEAVELNRYAEYEYHTQVWDYHEAILTAICEGDTNAAQKAFMQHTRLLHHQPRMQDMEHGAEIIESKVTE
ncbi:MAG: FCD domain-containing protein [Chloroflexi bacterium]|nr:FCD domain-containing protein [Chloroflexota bacterium]MCC6896955.1 FadR family transcriptional regulator [Anaerolineae bacterium]